MSEIRDRRKRTLALALLLFAVTLAIAAGAGLLLRSSFAKLQYARLFPLGYEPAAGAPQAAREVAQRLVVYGDSRAYLWKTSGSPPLRDALNLAHGSITSSQLLLQLQTEPPVRSEWALVQIGINDLHPLGALPELSNTLRGNLRTNIAAIARLLLQRSNHVLFTTVVPPGTVPWSRRLIWDERMPQYIAECNQAIRALPAADSRIAVLDAAALLGGDAVVLDARYVDPDFFLHLSPRAYSVLDAELLRIMSRSPASPAP
jgi:lysophospholipase L1-like esterase